MLLSRCSLLLLLVLTPGLVLAESLPAVVVTGDPVAPLPTQDGTGLCAATRVSTNPSQDFYRNKDGFRGGANTLLDSDPDASNTNARLTSVLRTPFDLSNNNGSGSTLSFGDFRGAVSGCPSGGCDFAITDASRAFGVRLRGYLRVTPDMVGPPVHFGLYADDAVALSLHDRQSNPYRVIELAPQAGATTWRTTNTVSFTKPGLYAVEVLYAEIAEHAALEMAVFVGTFSDFERPANQAPVVKLNDAGFSLLTPASFYQAESGRPSHPDASQCQQCNRQYANLPGSNGCDPGFHCGGAATCAPCDSADFCGSTCAPCRGRTSVCASGAGGFACVECGRASDCAPADACHVGVCDAAGTCSFPAAPEGTSCPGGVCQAGFCVTRTTPDGGGGSADGGVGMGDAGVEEGPVPGGCGCGTATPPLLPLGLLGLALLGRRGRRTDR